MTNISEKFYQTYPVQNKIFFPIYNYIIEQDSCIVSIYCKKYKCGHRNVLSKRQVWMSIFHIINFKKKKKHGHRGPGIF